MIRILYVHGYLGSANGSSSQLLAKCLSVQNIDARVDAPSIPITEPDMVCGFLKEQSKNHDVIVASSMGAFYSLTLSNKPVIAINSASPDDLRALGKSAPEINKDFSESDFALLEKIKEQIISGIKDNADNKYGIFGGEDTVATHNKWVRDALPAQNVFDVPGMEHKADEAGMNKVVEVIRKTIRI